MPRLRHPGTRVVVNVDEGPAEQMRRDGYRPADTSARDGYASMKVADLRAEIARRNAGREEVDRLPDDGRKADLIAVLEADDE